MIVKYFSLDFLIPTSPVFYFRKKSSIVDALLYSKYASENDSE